MLFCDYFKGTIKKNLKRLLFNFNHPTVCGADLGFPGCTRRGVTVSRPCIRSRAPWSSYQLRYTHSHAPSQALTLDPPSEQLQCQGC